MLSPPPPLDVRSIWKAKVTRLIYRLIFYYSALSLPLFTPSIFALWPHSDKPKWALSVDWCFTNTVKLNPESRSCLCTAAKKRNWNCEFSEWEFVMKLKSDSLQTMGKERGALWQKNTWDRQENFSIFFLIFSYQRETWRILFHPAALKCSFYLRKSREN